MRGDFSGVVKIRYLVKENEQQQQKPFLLAFAVGEKKKSVIRLQQDEQQERTWLRCTSEGRWGPVGARASVTSSSGLVRTMARSCVFCVLFIYLSSWSISAPVLVLAQKCVSLSRGASGSPWVLSARNPAPARPEASKWWRLSRAWRRIQDVAMGVTANPRPGAQTNKPGVG